MRFALDYDDTFTRDPAFWRAFIALAQGHGHEVVMVTFRDDRYDAARDLLALASSPRPIPVFYTRGIAKKFWMDHFGGSVPVDVWIDDRPESIFNNSSLTPSGVTEWRKTRSM